MPATMDAPTEPIRLDDFVPEQQAGHHTVGPLGWPDAAMIGGAIVTVGMMLVTAVGETQPWHFVVIAAGLLAFLAGAIKARAWE